MRTARVILLGMLFSFAGFVILSVISLNHIMVDSKTAHATGLSAMLGGVLEALFSPIMWLIIVVGFVAAMLVTRETKPTPTETTIKS